MTQSVLAQAKIILPEGTELVQSEELDSLKAQSLRGRAWTMQGLRDWLGRKSDVWIKDNILYNPKYSKEIQGMIAAGQIREPKAQGSAWMFKASVMSEWLDKHWEELPW